MKFAVCSHYLFKLSRKKYKLNSFISSIIYLPTKIDESLMLGPSDGIIVIVAKIRRELEAEVSEHPFRNKCV